jgi:hypothetical protein
LGSRRSSDVRAERIRLRCSSSRLSLGIRLPDTLVGAIPNNLPNTRSHLLRETQGGWEHVLVFELVQLVRDPLSLYVNCGRSRRIRSRRWHGAAGGGLSLCVPLTGGTELLYHIGSEQGFQRRGGLYRNRAGASRELSLAGSLLLFEAGKALSGIDRRRFVFREDNALFGAV